MSILFNASTLREKTFISLPCLRQEHTEVSNFKRTSWIFWKTESLLLGPKKTCSETRMWQIKVN